MYQIILASESPRRKEIMETMGIPYLAIPAEVKEETGETAPEKIVQALARLKAQATAKKAEEQLGKGENRIVIGADTMVFYQEHVLGKPKDTADAERMLQLLSDDEHEVLTGVHIILTKDGITTEHSFAVSTRVFVLPLSKEQILDYIATGEPMDKAGAYAIQGKFGIYIKEIRGDYYNIVGFPISKIYSTLLELGIDIKK
jgi:septum formation protein